MKPWMVWVGLALGLGATLTVIGVSVDEPVPVRVPAHVKMFEPDVPSGWTPAEYECASGLYRYGTDGMGSPEFVRACETLTPERRAAVRDLVSYWFDMRPSPSGSPVSPTAAGEEGIES